MSSGRRARGWSARLSASLGEAARGRRARRVRRVSGHAFRGDGGADPLLSVVVPVYGVEPYVAECLRSILTQTYRNLEVIVVDDGSLDRAMDIVRLLATTDDRIRILAQPNSGLAAARNRGIAEARGELVTFVDSDDTVPPAAFAQHVRSLLASGSDFSVGALERQVSESTYVQKPWSKRLHEHHRPGVTIDEAPDVLPNVFACTKVFRRDFLQRIGFAFPDGASYEDQVPITQAYLLARTFDILPSVVYRWRARSDGSSITQQKSRLADLQDRLRAIEECEQLVHAYGSLAVQRSWFGKVFAFDLVGYVRASLDANEAYRSRLAAAIQALVEAAPEGMWEYVELRHRFAAWAIIRSDHQTLRRLLAAPLAGNDFPVRRRDGRLEADLAKLGLEDVDVPPETRLVSEQDLRVHGHLGELAWHGRRLSVRGLAYTHFVEEAPDAAPARLELRRPESDEPPVVVETARVEAADANVTAQRTYENHRHAGFAAEIDADGLLTSVESSRRSWQVTLACEALGAVRSAPFTSRAHHGTVTSAQRVLVEGVLLEASWSSRLGLVVSATRSWAVATRIESTASGAEIDFAVPPGTEVGAVWGRGARRGTVRPLDVATGRWRVSLSAADLPLDAPRTRLLVELPAGREALVALDPGGFVPLGGTGPAGLVQTTGGTVRLVRAERSAFVEDASFTEDAILVAGTWAGEPPSRVELVGPRARVATTPDVSGQRFTASLSLHQASALAGRLPLPADDYRVHVDGVESTGRVGLDASRSPYAPEWTVWVVDGARVLLRRERPDAARTRSRFDRRALQKRAYVPAREGARRPAVLLDSFRGRGPWHTLGAVAQELRELRPDLELLWTVNDTALPVPDGVTPLLRHTEEWYAALASASHVMTNDLLPLFFDKAPGQRVVQVWPGTPIQRFGHSVKKRSAVTTAELRPLDRSVAQWDVLYAGSDLAGYWLREATGFEGPVVTVGHPAVDPVMAAPAGLRRRVRDALGIGDGPVLLYAPTSREPVRAHTKRGKVNHLDVAALTAAVPDLTVLYRGHPTTSYRATLRDQPGLVDVTAYPELAHLIEAADVLVTDYSSALTHFLASGKPIALLAPDLGAFLDRGFFYDLIEAAPGPVALTTEDLLPWLGNPGHSDLPAADELRRRLLPADDGKAARRLVEAEFGG